MSPVQAHSLTRMVVQAVRLVLTTITTSRVHATGVPMIQDKLRWLALTAILHVSAAMVRQQATV